MQLIYSPFYTYNFQKINKKIIKIKKQKQFLIYFLNNFLKIPSYRIFLIYQGTVPESLRYLSQKI